MQTAHDILPFVPGRPPANVEELRAESDRIRRESLRVGAERERAELYRAQLESVSLELDALRE